MEKVFLNGNIIDKNQATISPMDRGFLFGDGVYEVIPTYDTKPIGLSAHLARLRNSLLEVEIQYDVDESHWREVIKQLLNNEKSSSTGIYIHISRGTEERRFHAYQNVSSPTVFAYAFDIPPPQPAAIDMAKTFKVKTVEDLRWKRCHIKSTSLLGNVMHYQQGYREGLDEVIMYNNDGYITEAASCNVFVVKGNKIATPVADHQILPGITRLITIKAINTLDDLSLEIRNVHKSELENADEVWLTSSSKEIGVVCEINGRQIGDGRPGNVWLATKEAYDTIKFDC